ncbi:hypothetical protein MATL_G00015750 [Megalops atlanticus]|uniref:Peroxiredoxin-like 2A n=1 Tax=Megalops atlanticus TaxID=7932 RepID=A0A9D3TEV8_MEGAT|nr:hypothetical protein MATL_G00015750 [Megalops atlanticus]
MGILVQGVGAVVALIEGILRVVTDVFLTKPLPASLEYLEDADLKTLDGEERTLKARTLEEASELSSLKPQLEELGVPLYAVVKENISTEVQDFRPYFAGEIFLDEKKRFYGPRQRKLGLLAFLRLGVWKNGLRAFRNGFLGNVYGEGFILGGVYVIGAGQQGVMLEHREMEFGDKVNILDVLRAARRIPVELVEK